MLQRVSLAELANGQVIELAVGDILQVWVSFKYVVAEDTIVTLRACPYAGLFGRVGGSCGEADIELERSTTAKLKEAAVDMPIVPAAEGGIENGTYGVCEGEGEPIPKARLEAIPWARYCVNCATLVEKGRLTVNDEEDEIEPDSEE